MFTLPGLLALLVAHYAKVHEIVPWLRPLPVLHFLYALACLGFLLDVRLRLVRVEASPHLKLVLPLWLWTLVSLAMTGMLQPGEVISTMTYMVPFILIAHVVQGFRSLRFLAFFILANSLFLGVVGILQATSPFECIRLSAEGASAGRPDGRPCETAGECREDAEPWEDYICERPGPFNTNSVAGGRIRYRGILEDPNELALIMVLALPLALAARSRSRSLLDLLLPIAAVGITLPVVIRTSSRTGQLAFLAAVAVFVLKGRGWKGLLATAVLALPVLLLGGRSGESADESSTERLEAWGVGINLLKGSPLWGVGKGQFLDHHYLTAHNTFVLESAELGFIGVVLWVGILYLDFKILVLALRRFKSEPATALPCIWARALLASLCALTVGVNFLSLGYHPLVWTYLALPGAYYLAVRRHDPDFHVVFGLRDLLASVGIPTVYLAVVKVYLMVRGV